MLSTRSGSGLPLLFAVQGRFVTQCLSRLSTALNRLKPAKKMREGRRPSTHHNHTHTPKHITHMRCRSLQVRTLKKYVRYIRS